MDTKLTYTERVKWTTEKIEKNCCSIIYANAKYWILKKKNAFQCDRLSTVGKQ